MILQKEIHQVCVVGKDGVVYSLAKTPFMVGENINYVRQRNDVEQVPSVNPLQILWSQSFVKNIDKIYF